MTSLIAERSTLRGWIVCLTASLFFFYEFVQLMMFNSITPELMQAFHATASVAGRISAAYFLANMIFMFPAGILLDHFSARRLIISAMILCILGTLLFSWAHTIFFAMICRFLTGIGGSFPFLCCLRLSSRWFPPRRWALVSGVMLTVAYLGGVTGQTPIIFLVNLLGWRHALQIDALLGVLFIGLIAVIVFDYPKNTVIPSVSKSSASIVEMIFSACCNRQNWLFGLYAAMFNLPMMVLGAIWGNLYLVQVFGVNNTAASVITSMILFGAIVGCPILGWLSDRWGRRKSPMMLLGIGSLFVLIMIMKSSSWSAVELGVLFFLLGFMTSAQVIIFPAISESNQTTITGSALGLASMLIMGMPTIMQPLFGWLMDSQWKGAFVNGVPWYSFQSFHWGLMSLVVSFVIALIGLHFTRETYCQIQEHLFSNKKVR